MTPFQRFRYHATTRWDEWRAGWRVVGTLLRSPTHGEPRVTWPSPSGAFYLLGWWWEGEHIIVPQLIEEARIAKELESTFGEKTWTWGDGVTINTSGSPKMVIGNSGSIGLGTVAPSALLTISPETLSPSLVVNPQSGQTAGHWEWESIKIGTNTHPHPFRQWILRTLIGMKYSPITSETKSDPTRSSSPTPLWTLIDCLDSAPTHPTPTN